MDELEFFKNGWSYRKSAGGWSVDVKIENSWIFLAKHKTKKEAIAFIKQHLDDPKLKYAQEKKIEPKVYEYGFLRD